MPLDPIALARQLIDVPSPTESELAVAELLENELTRLGFTTRRHDVTPTRFNLLALAGGTPRVILNSHLDTVPPWFASSEDEEFIYGRGACDTKGIIAAMIAAGERLRARGVDQFAFLFVVGEETDSVGAKAANMVFENLGSEYVVVGEPTESKFARASKGALTCVIRFDGVAAHSAYPHLGESAINRMVAAIAEINAADWGSHEILGKTTVNVGVVRGGQRPNIVPAEAECELIFRLVTTPEEIEQRLGDLVANHNGRITLSRGNPPQFMVVPEGQPSAVVAFNTDVPWLSSLGKPLLFGPGSILDAHGVNEKIAKQDLLDAVTTYEEMVVALLEGRIAPAH
ncbi:MAG TPA: M20/M25/M40 family metallo-hydrolase [Thermoanaerobaculia bacterium]|nr:M20/M25/M40 family metallo-hydrolase [Thermoanaerobaculia bacterium]